MAYALVVRFGVIELARRHRRRRLLATATAVATAGIAAAVALTAASGPRPRLASRAAPTAVLARAPAVGMACLTPRACDRVGVAVWLRRPATSVSAIVAGHAVALGTSAAAQFEATAQRGTRTMFVGYFRWPGLAGSRILFAPGPPSAWSPRTPADWPAPTVRIRIRSGDRITTTQTRVQLRGGWG